MFKTILVPTDGSDSAAKAVAIASDLAASHSARVVLLHVISAYDITEELARFAAAENIPNTEAPSRVHRLESTPQGPIAIGGGIEEEVDRPAVMREISARLLEDAKGIANQHGVQDVEVVTETGDPVERILDCAARERADAIVIGSRGMSDLKGAILGSVSHEVCHKADRTCITVAT